MKGQYRIVAKTYYDWIDKEDKQLFMPQVKRFYFVWVNISSLWLEEKSYAESRITRYERELVANSKPLEIIDVNND